MKRLVAVFVGLIGAASLAMAPAAQARPFLMVGVGNAALIQFNGSNPGAVTQTTLIMASVSTEGVAIVNNVPRLVLCQHPFKRSWVDAGMYTKATGAGGANLRVLQFHVKTTNGAYKAGNTYSFIQEVRGPAGGNLSHCNYIDYTPSAATIAKAASPNGFIWTPPIVF